MHLKNEYWFNYVWNSANSTKYNDFSPQCYKIEFFCVSGTICAILHNTGCDQKKKNPEHRQQPFFGRKELQPLLAGIEGFVNIDIKLPQIKIN